MSRQVWILTLGDYGDPTAILGVYTTAERGREWFTRTALQHFSSIDAITEGENGALRLEGGADFLDLSPHTECTADPGREIVTYRGAEHAVMWLGTNTEGVPVVQIVPLGAGVRQTVRVADLDQAR